MRRLEEQILTEKYRRIEGKLTFSVRLAELSVAPGEAAEGAFTIFASQEEIPAQGYVLTKDERMECKTEWFNGVQEKIVYRFCADGLQEGDSLQGQFLIISDYGEYTLPWKVTVRREAAAGIAGKVSTLAGFTELARTDWKTAVQFFYSKPFAEICKKEGEKTWLLYRGLSAGYYNSSNVETFLERLQAGTDLYCCQTGNSGQRRTGNGTGRAADFKKWLGTGQPEGTDRGRFFVSGKKQNRGG